MKRQTFWGLLAVSLLSTSHLFAQGTAFTYQGRLADGTMAASGLYDFRFSVFSVASGGSPVSPVLASNALPVSNGLFSITLDFGPGIFIGPDRLLQIEVKTNGSPDPHAVLSPRQPLTASPYAIFSGTAATVTSNAIGNAQLQGGSINATNIAPGQVVKSLNGLRDVVTISAGANVTLTPSGNDLQISSSPGNDWRLRGNNAVPGDFLGTTNLQPLDLRVNGLSALRLVPTFGAPNVIGGSPNIVAAGVQGATIGGGGSNSATFGPHIISADWGVIGGGLGNQIDASSRAATIGGGWANWIQADAPNASIAGGYANLIEQNTDFGAIGGGSGNHIENDSRFAVISGGALNDVGSFTLYSSVGGGLHNSVGASGATIAGGSNNVANGPSSFVGGGRSNFVSSGSGVIAGGENNLAQGPWSAIGGGQNNRATSSAWSVIAGGDNNAVRSQWATVGGGNSNAATNGFATTISGGSQNYVANHYAVIGGGFANGIGTNGRASVISGGELNFALARDSSIGGGIRNTISVNAANAVIGGGGTNSVSGQGATVAGGESNQSDGSWSVVGGGFNNTAIAESSTVAGGSNNDATGSWNSIGGGAGNTTSASHSTVAGGWVNTASDHKAAVGGGSFNVASGFHSTVPGGANNQAIGDYSFAAGRLATATHSGSFVWADDIATGFGSTATRQFAVRANNGVMIQSTNTALDLRGGGAVRVAGAGIGTATPVFVHRATPANIFGHMTIIDHPHCNNDPNAILIITPNYNPSDTGNIYNNHPVGVYYTASRWRIFNQDLVAMLQNAAFNVLVAKP